MSQETRAAELRAAAAAAETAALARAEAAELAATKLTRRLRERELRTARELGYTAGYDRGYEAGKTRYHTDRNRTLTLLPLHPGYLRAWLGLLITISALEIASGVLTLPRWPWVIVVVIFFLIEALAIQRNRPGDTFSELMWTFLWGGKARAWLVGATGVYLPLRLFGLAYPALLPSWLPLAVLSLGLGAWLLPHLLKLGREG